MNLFSFLDLLGTLAFAISGASLAIDKKFDLFGVYVLAFVTAVGGGTIRDLLTDSPVAWMRNDWLIGTIVAGATISIIFNRFVKKMSYAVYLFDAMGLGLFTMAGIQRGIQLEYNLFICVSLGTVSATFGGLIRDLITGEPPMLLTRKEIYALAGASGGMFFFLIRSFGWPEEVTVPIGIVTIFLIRHLCLRMGIRLPTYDPAKGWTRSR